MQHGTMRDAGILLGVLTLTQILPVVILLGVLSVIPIRYPPEVSPSVSLGITLGVQPRIFP